MEKKLHHSTATQRILYPAFLFFNANVRLDYANN